MGFLDNLKRSTLQALTSKKTASDSPQKPDTLPEEVVSAYFKLLDPEARSFFGRANELKRIEAVWEECREYSTPRLLILQGKVGAGKSRLITEFLKQNAIAKRFITLVGRCNEADIPYAPYAGILATILNQKLTSAITQEQMNQLLSHIPSLTRLLNITEARKLKDSSGPENIPIDPLSGQWQFFTTVLSILTELGPTVLFLEDATFLDEASVAMTQFLVQQQQLPLLLVAACRDMGGAKSWFDAFSTIEKEVITLATPSKQVIKDYLENALGGPVPEPVTTLIHQRSQGKFFDIAEIAYQLIESNELYQDEDGQWHYTRSKERTSTLPFLPSKSGYSIFTRQIEKLTAQDREALALAALIESGPEFDFNLWLALLGGESQRELAQSVLNEALEKRLLRQVDDNRYIFYPADLYQTLISTLPQTHRRDLHRQSAEILDQKQVDPILVGYHYEQAGLATEAARYLEAAAVQAVSTNAIKTAIDYYNRVVALAESQSAYRALGNLYRQQGKWDDSLLAFQRALALAEESGDIAAQAHALNGLSFTLWLYDDYEAAYEPAAAVLQLSGVPDTERATAQSHLGMIAWLRGRLSEAEEWCQKSVRALEKSGDEFSLAGAYNRLGLVHFSQGKLAETHTMVQRSLELRQKLGDHWGQGYCLTNLGRVAAERGDFEQALSLFESAQQLFKKGNSQDGLMVVHTNYGRTLLYRGQPNEALPWLIKAQYLAMRIGKLSAFGLSEIYLYMAQANLAHGELDEAKAATDDAMKLAQDAGNQEYIAAAQANLAQVYAAQGDQAAATEMYQKALALFEDVGCRVKLLRLKFKYAQFLTQQGQSAQAATLEQETRAEAANIGLYLP